MNKRLLYNLPLGTTYLLTDGIRFYILYKKLQEGKPVWYIKEKGSVGTPTAIYIDSWDDVLSKYADIDYDHYYEIRNYYNLSKPTYTFEAFLKDNGICGSVKFDCWRFKFLGEYNNETLEKYIKYCEVFGIKYMFMGRKERLKELYGNKIKKL